MKVTDKIYPAGETALILRNALGPIRSWNDCLTDMRLGKTDVCGFILRPVGKRHDGRSSRPVYALTAIKEFICKVWTAEPEARVNLPAQGVYVEFDPDMDWHAQKLVAASVVAH